VIDVPRPDVEILSPYNKDGIVEDWDAAEALWKYSFAHKLTGVRPNRALQEWLNDPNAVPDLQKAMAEAVDTERCLEDHPLFMTEPSWNPTKAREKAVEIALESWSAPAFYLGRSGVMGAFAAGKPTALVVDFGASQVSVTPVHDGMILKKGITRAPIGGNFLSQQVRNMLATTDENRDHPITITPHYLVSSKQPVDAGQPANFIQKPFPADFTPPRPSFNHYQQDKVIHEFKEITLQAWAPHQQQPQTGGIPFRGQGEMLIRDNQHQYAQPFEFPNGYNQTFSSERFRIVETMFDPQCYYPPSPGTTSDSNFPAPDQSQTIPALIKSSLNAVDVDIRPFLLSNIIITGGSSFIRSLPDRIHAELTRLYPSARIRINAAGMPVERKFASWIGGSIVASLGSFHQMWISKREYEDVGAGIVEKRCK
jgi:actin-related protein 4